MSTSNFVDYVKICCRSGKGGGGSVHLLRTAQTAKGGPDGGDGGRGGHVIVRGNKQLWTLIHLKYRKHVIAEDGGKGGRNNMSGAEGKDEIIEVPLGTIIKDPETMEVIKEINDDGEEFIVVPGGRGGKGNTFFATSTRQTPRFAQPGEPGGEEWKVLELKLLADVGLVGFPNAGKSTLLSVVSAAKPEIADYPFTTLVPNLGIVNYRGDRSFVMADIPGIIEGAAEGKGLGVRFLRHIERNSILLFLVPADSNDIIKDYNILLNELDEYNPELMHKKRILGISKADLLDDELYAELKKDMDKKIKKLNIPYVIFSSATGKNLQQLKDELWKLMN
ncbi:MAG TPA: GTPase ObgE [Bacteroidia bacterium]|jgi:GTP-binding protein|nr:GTPase ObgE [Bacteroidia bacterium]